MIPYVPVRQWVLSLPFWARLLVARTPLLLTRTLGRALREIFRSLGRRAEERGVQAGRPGAITFIQFFGGQLNLNPHLHCVIPDGVFVRVDGVIRFEPLGAPTEEELQEILGRIAARVTKLLRPAREKASDDAQEDEPEPNRLPLEGAVEKSGRQGHSCFQLPRRCAKPPALSISPHGGIWVSAWASPGWSDLVDAGSRSRQSRSCRSGAIALLDALQALRIQPVRLSVLRGAVVACALGAVHLFHHVLPFRGRVRRSCAMHAAMARAGRWMR